MHLLMSARRHTLVGYGTNRVPNPPYIGYGTALS